MNTISIVFCFGENDNPRYLSAVIPYLHHSTFLVAMLKVGNTQLELYSLEEKGPRISIPAITKNNIEGLNYYRKRTLGQRLLDLLILESIVTEDRTTLFVFNNYELSYLAEAVKARINCKIITFYNSFAWETLFPDKTYFQLLLSLENKASTVARKLYSTRDLREAKIFNASDLVLCYTAEAKHFVERTYALNSHKLAVWKFGGEYFGSAVKTKVSMQTRKKEIRQRMLIGKNTKVITYFDSSANEWGAHQLLSVIPLLMKRFPDLKIIVTGSFPDLSKLVSACAPNWANIIFTGEVDNSIFFEFMLVSDVMISLPQKEVKDNSILNVLINEKLFVTTKYAAPLWIRKKFKKYISLLPLFQSDGQLGLDGTLIFRCLDKMLRRSQTEIGSPGLLQKKIENGLLIKERAKELKETIITLCKGASIE